MRDATISAAGLRVMKLLVGNPPQTVAELLRGTGVTRTAVSEQLDELVAAGLVRRDTQRLLSRGRPRHLYRATDAALRLFGSSQPSVLPAIWEAIREVGGEELVDKVLKRVTRELVEYYDRKITARKPLERLRQFVDLMASEGALIEVVDDGEGRMMLYKRSCPYVGMVDPQRTYCRIDEAVLNALVGHVGHKKACRHDGAPCCAFEITNGTAGGR